MKLSMTAPYLTLDAGEFTYLTHNGWRLVDTLDYSGTVIYVFLPLLQ